MNLTRKNGALVCLVVFFLSVITAKKIAEAHTFAYNPVEKSLQSHLFLDKQLYKPGEDVNYRLWLFDSVSSSMILDPEGHGKLTITDPLGRELFKRDVVKFQGSVIQGKWHIESYASGGDYTLNVELEGRCAFPKVTRKFRVQNFRNPLINIESNFLKDGYQPGERVTVIIKASRADGTPLPAGSPVHSSLSFGPFPVPDIEKIFTDDRGLAVISFQLPLAESQEHGPKFTSMLLVQVQDGDLLEQKSFVVPVFMEDQQNIIVTLYPESGSDLVDGITSKVYFEAVSLDSSFDSSSPKSVNENSIAIDITAELISCPNHHTENEDEDENQQEPSLCPVEQQRIEIKQIKSIHQGRGLFDFVPDSTRTYFFRVTRPTSSPSKHVFTLPPIQNADSGIVFGVESSVIQAGKGDIKVSVIAPSDHPSLSVLLWKKETLIDSITFEDQSSEVLQASFAKSNTWPLGVLRLVLLETDSMEPLAERLIFVRPSEENLIQVTVTTDQEDYAPGSEAIVTVKTTDFKGDPISSYVAITITDESGFKLVERKDRHPRLPESLLLEYEVKKLEDPAVFLPSLYTTTTGVSDLNHDEIQGADKALDLLISNQLWRHLGFNQRQELHANFEEISDRLFGVYYRERAFMAMEKNMMRHRRGNEAILLLEVNEGVMYGSAAMHDTACGSMTIQFKPDEKFQTRSNWAQTIYFSAQDQTDPDNGELTFRVKLSDSITKMRITADVATAHSIKNLERGPIPLIGASLPLTFSIRAPISVEPKLPASVVTGDRLLVPITISNRMADSAKIKVNAVGLGTNLNLIRGPSDYVTVPSMGTKRIFLEINVVEDVHSVVDPESLSVQSFMMIQAEQLLETGESVVVDQIKRTIGVYSRGRPVELNSSGLLSAELPGQLDFSIPESVSAASISASVKAYNSQMSTIIEALKSMLRQPFGCFEQTSSTTYPNIMILQFLKENPHLVDATILQKATDLIKEGYEKLVQFETVEKGFEWFGASPAHEALTAFGLMEFIDINSVLPNTIEPSLVQRTLDYLLSKKTPTGFQRNDRALDTFGRAPDSITNAYIIWALTTAGLEVDLDDQLNSLMADKKAMEDPYVLALLSISLHNLGRTAESLDLAKRLVPFQTSSGSVGGSDTSITRSQGISLEIETTSLSILAWTKHSETLQAATKAAKWLMEQCEDGRFGSTQATVLSLKALLAFDVVSPIRPRGEYEVLLDEKTILKFKIDPEKVSDPSSLIDSNLITQSIRSSFSSSPGPHRLSIRAITGSNLRFSISLKYFSDEPVTTGDPGAEEKALTIQALLGSTSVSEGSLVPLEIRVTNEKKEDTGMVLVNLEIPAGLEASFDQLAQMKNVHNLVTHFEVKGEGRQLVLYFVSFRPNQVLDIHLDLIATIPGSYRASPSSVYEYYRDEVRGWTSSGLTLLISPSN